MVRNDGCKWVNKIDGVHFTASYFAAPLMIAQKSGLIINTSAGDSGKFIHNTMYHTAKSAVDCLAFGMAKELRKHQVAAVSLYPGFVYMEKSDRALTTSNLVK
jgi:NAD(P)-dependent dehydrogenase (short-subunit alcohol dehydrogenase family)